MPVKSLNAFNEGAEWPPPSEKERLKRYRENRILWKGKADRITQRLGTPYVPAIGEADKFILNIHKRLSTLWADMLFGEQPLWSAGDDNSREYKALQELITRIKLNTVGYEVALDCSIYGDGVLRVAMEGGKATIDAQPPRHWFPVVSPNNIRRVTAHVLADVIDYRSPAGISRQYLVLEIHTRGKIQHRIHELNNTGQNAEGGKIGPRVSLTGILPEIAARENVGDVGLEQTGVDDFLIIPVHNLRTSDETYGKDDYSDLDTIINGLEERLDQINDILRKHAEPILYGSQLSMTQNAGGAWIFNSQDKFFPLFDKEDVVPGYVTWDGKLDDALANFNLLTEQLYLISETTPAAFGQLKSGLAESGSALKRLMFPVLGKTSRLQMHFDPAMKQALTVAGELENQDFGDIGSQWFDGLPNDITELSQSIQLMVTSGVMSRYQAISKQNPDWTDAQIQDEIDAIDLDSATVAGAGGGLPPANIDPTNGEVSSANL